MTIDNDLPGSDPFGSGSTVPPRAGAAGTHEAERDSRPLTTLFGELAGETSSLIRKEMELAKAEMSEKVSQVTTGATSIAVGGAVAYAGLLFLLLAATYGLAEFLSPWLSALIVGAVVAVIGLVMLSSGRSKLKAANLEPTRTIETIKDDGRWARAQVGTAPVGTAPAGAGATADTRPRP